MAIEFDNPLTAGTTLIREAIQSGNFLRGVSGWIIEQDGDAEFNSVVIRGGTVLGGQAFYYDGTPGPGKLLVAIAAAGGTDPYGNVYGPGITVFGAGSAEVRTDPDGFYGAGTYYTPPVTPGQVYDAGAVVADTEQLVAGQDRPVVRIIGSASLAGGGAKPGIDLYGEGNHGETSLIHVSATKTEFGNAVDVQGVLTAANEAEGAVTATMAAVSFVDVPVSFGKTFPSAPYVTALLVGGASLPAGSSALTVRAFNVTTTGCTLRVNDVNGVARTLSHGVHWHAKSS